MQRSDFSYELPPELIAQSPPVERAGARMLAVCDDRLVDAQVRDFAQWLRPDDLLVVNDTRVIPARLRGQKDSGGRVEILVERLLGPTELLAQVRSSKPLQEGRLLHVSGARLRVSGRSEAFYRLVSEDGPVQDLLEAAGEVPLPPYIARSAQSDDRERYQTIFARQAGAVAAPTAGLHFDDQLLGQIRAIGVALESVTLHVGAGTFSPVREEDLSRHHMHAEQLIVGASVVEAVAATRARGGRVVAVGTTVVRALESAAQDGALSAWSGDTRLFITPGYKFRVVDALLTNFHLPESTLLMLVSAFAGQQRVLAAYRHAVRQRYRFFSYGDAMWIPQGLPADARTE